MSTITPECPHCQTVHLKKSFLFPHTPQSQYVFVHDAIDELIRCGETDIAAGDIRIAIANLMISKTTGGVLTGFQKEFEARMNGDSDPGQRMIAYSLDTRGWSIVQLCMNCTDIHYVWV